MRKNGEWGNTKKWEYIKTPTHVSPLWGLFQISVNSERDSKFWIVLQDRVPINPDSYRDNQLINQPLSNVFPNPRLISHL
jgi:hypothetical protein